MKTVGIVGRSYYNKDNQSIFQINEDLRRSISTYSDVVSIPLLPTENVNYTEIENSSDKIDTKKLDYILDRCDAFIIPGGTKWYNFDEYVIRHAIKKDKPLLCICLGFQALCSMYAKKRSKFDMTKKLNNDKHYGNPNKYIHSINIEKNTKLYEIIGQSSILVNSIHHDYIAFQMDDLIVSALSEDGIIEAVELPNKKFIVALQWHPEYLKDENSKKIFDSFIDKA